MKFEEWKKERSRISYEMQREVEKIEKHIPAWRKRAWEISRDLGVCVRKFQAVGDLGKRMELALNDIEELKETMAKGLAKQLNLELESEELSKAGVQLIGEKVPPVEYKEVADLAIRERDVFGKVVAKLKGLDGYLEGLKDVVKSWIAEERVEDDVLKDLS